MKILLAGLLGILAITGFFIFSSSKPNNELNMTSSPIPRIEESESKNADIRAAFVIFTNGTFQVFTASMYHNLSPDVFIEASNPNIVRIKKNGITWDDFFKTLPMKLTRDCLTTGTGQTFCTKGNQTLKLYINGQLDSTALNRTINAGDQLLVSYGGANDVEIKEQLLQVSTMSQN